MTDILIIIGLLSSVWLLAIFFMRGANPNTGSYETTVNDKGQVQLWSTLGKLKSRTGHKAYDPMTDEHKILNGEVESYFD